MICFKCGTQDIGWTPGSSKGLVACVSCASAMETEAERREAKQKKKPDEQVDEDARLGDW